MLWYFDIKTRRVLICLQFVVQHSYWKLKLSICLPTAVVQSISCSIQMSVRRRFDQFTLTDDITNDFEYKPFKLIIQKVVFTLIAGSKSYLKARWLEGILSNSQYVLETKESEDLKALDKLLYSYNNRMIVVLPVEIICLSIFLIVNSISFSRICTFVEFPNVILIPLPLLAIVL